MIHPQRSPHLHPTLFRRVVPIIAILAQLGGFAFGAESLLRTPRAVSPAVITSFEQIWQMTETESKEWHRLRMEYVVYYYDPLWSAMWGRSGEADSYLSVGSKPFPIKSGQRILVEGLILPAKGMNVDEPKVTVLAETAPLEVLSTRGEIGNTQRFNKRLVTVEGYVNRQVARRESPGTRARRRRPYRARAVPPQERRDRTPGE